jgi:hypothetical protein
MSASTLLALLALGALTLALWLWPARAAARRRGGGVWARRLCSLLLLCIATLAILLTVAVHGYRPWRAGSVIAEVAVQADPAARERHFLLRLSLPGRVPQAYTLQGDQWQLDVRLLRWKLPAALLGAPRIYLPDRLSGRYADVEEERRSARNVHALADADDWDAWRLKRRLAGWLPLLASDYGSSAYLPLIDDTRFRIQVGDAGGIVVYPADARTARRLLEQDW